jgi:hypothetical protein
LLICCKDCARTLLALASNTQPLHHAYQKKTQQEARKAGAAAGAAANGLHETDDYIDDAMDSYEASLDYNEA